LIVKQHEVSTAVQIIRNQDRKEKARAQALAFLLSISKRGKKVFATDKLPPQIAPFFPAKIADFHLKYSLEGQKLTNKSTGVFT
jgi:hypothetical protein